MKRSEILKKKKNQNQTITFDFICLNFFCGDHTMLNECT